MFSACASKATEHQPAEKWTSPPVNGYACTHASSYDSPQLVAMEPPKTTAWRRIVAGAIVCAFCMVDLFTPMFIDAGPEWPAMIMLGICIGQVNRIATWAALAPGNVVVRLPWALLLSALMWYSIVWGARWMGADPYPYFSLDDAVILAIFLFVGVAAAQVPLWIARRVFRWRLVSWAGAAREPSQDRLQFQLWHMMLGMLFVSLALAPGRLVLPPGDLADLDLEFEMFAMLAALVACNLLIAVPCIWGAFARATILVPLAFGWLIYCGGVTVLEFVVLVSIFGPVPRDEMPILMYLLNVTQCGTVFGTLLLFRALGFRLVRVPSGRAREAGQSPFAPAEAADPIEPQ